jgi:hypothetical protein
MKFHEENLPCVSKNVLNSLNVLVDGNDYSKDNLNKFFEKFGTHASISAKFGG